VETIGVVCTFEQIITNKIRGVLTIGTPGTKICISKSVHYADVGFTPLQRTTHWAHARVWGMEDNAESFLFQQHKPDVCIPSIFMDMNFDFLGAYLWDAYFRCKTGYSVGAVLSPLLFFVMAALLY
jgi:hypothetical protein